MKLEKPLLVEGPAGVGKTELAKSLAKALSERLIRLQCYEGLDESRALYEWAYSKQLLYIQMLKELIHDTLGNAQTIQQAVDLLSTQEDAFYSRKFLLPRPLLESILQKEPCVLLIDEIDKADPEFEAFLLEFLANFAMTIPELGVIQATTPPIVLLTSNDQRDLSDALKRRCLHLYIDYPEPSLEKKILWKKVPEIEEKLLDQAMFFLSGFTR